MGEPGIDVDEAVRPLSGADWWNTPAAAGVPALKVTDGPSGARGELFVGGPPSVWFPCGAALGATWDVELAARLGEALADEARAKGAHVLLGPTVNLQRDPLGGRHFECLSEDPLLSAHLATAYVRALQGAGLWKEVQDRLDRPGASLSGGQQQRLCIARAIAVEPQVLLMDEPCSALDPVSTLRIEDLIAELKDQYTIVIVTHNMQQAARVSDSTAFFNLEVAGDPGRLVEMGPTSKIYTRPEDERTEAYITGRFG